MWDADAHGQLCECAVEGTALMFGLSSVVRTCTAHALAVSRCCVKCARGGCQDCCNDFECRMIVACLGSTPRPMNRHAEAMDHAGNCTFAHTPHDSWCHTKADLR